MLSLSSGWNSQHTHTPQLNNFRVDRRTYSHIFIIVFSMVQIKLFVAFILAATAIARVVALPAATQSTTAVAQT